MRGVFQVGKFDPEIVGVASVPTWDITEKNATSIEPGFIDWNSDKEGRTEPLFSTSTSQRLLTLTLENEHPGSGYTKVSASIFGGASYLGGSHEVEKADGNIVTINLGTSTQLYSPHILGGRSAQQLGEHTHLNGGSTANKNQVLINGGVEGVSNHWDVSSYVANTTQSLVVQRIYGGSGSEANNNLVALSKVVLFSNMGSQNLGIRGGDGNYGGRIFSKFNKEANFNTVLITNSYVGLVKSDAVDWGRGSNFNVYGGWSIGETKGNIVAIENSVINGNVYGGFEFQDQLTIDGTKFRDLHANLVSIHNVELKEENAIYGTTTAVGSETSPGSGVLKESEIKGVDRRRGVVYLAGENKVGSLYVRFAHFGQYLDTQGLQNTASERNTDILSASDYYPIVGKVVSYSGTSVRNLENTIRLFNNQNNETIALGQLVGNSYIQNNSGFHSSLAARDKNQSDLTNQYHNFWVGSYANITSAVSGDGTSFNTTRKLFSDDGNSVNHYYVDAQPDSPDTSLSLLTHDDGMMYRVGNLAPGVGHPETNNPHNASLLHNLQYHYNGLILYLGVNNGKDAKGKPINAVQISFNEIEEFRTHTSGQSLGALGNTFVGIFRDNGRKDSAKLYFKESTKNDKTSVDWKDVTFDVPDFEIMQSGKHVANATYGFYKYMHFDGSEGAFKPTASQGIPPSEVWGTVSTAGEPGGVGIAYWLKSVDVLANNVLRLNGKKEDSVLSKDGASPSENQDLYTLSAQVTGDGSILISKNSTVVLGAPNTIYTIDINKSKGAEAQDLTNAIVFDPSLVKPNEYRGFTKLEENSKLAAGKDGAFGETSLLDLSAENSAVYLQKHKQTVKSLKVGPSSILSLSKVDLGVREGFDEAYHADAGGPESAKIGLTVTEDAFIEGQLTGDSESALNINQLLKLSANENEFLGTLTLQDLSEAYFESESPLARATLRVGKNSRAYFDGLTPSENVTTVQNLTNAGKVFLTSKIFRSAGYDGQRLVLNTYHGSPGSEIVMKGLLGTATPAQSVDKVLVNDTATGKSFINFSALPGSVGQLSDPIVIFQAKHNTEQSEFNLDLSNPIFVEEEGSPAHINEYLLGHSQDKKDWYLYLKPKDDSEKPPLKLEDVFSFLSPKVGAYISANLAQRTTHMRLHDRMGQASFIDENGQIQRSALWLRQVGTHAHMRTEGVKIHQKVSVTQLGADIWRMQLSEQLSMVSGVYVGGLYSTSLTRNILEAKSRNKGCAVGIYGTIFTGASPDDSWYVDSWLQFGNYSNKLIAEDSSVKYKSHGFAWSLETGYKVPLGVSGKGSISEVSWTIQPQAQLIWDGIRTNNLRYESGLLFKQIGKDNVTLRLGLRLAGKTTQGSSAFIEGGWIHNTKKLGLRASLKDEQEDVVQDAGRNLGELRLGLEGSISKNLKAWGTASLRQGARATHEEAVQIGVKYTF